MKKSILIIASLATGLFLASCSGTEAAGETAEAAKEKMEETTEMVEKVVKDVAAVETIKLEETEGKFTTESLSLKAGQEYNFEITNNAGRPAAFVLVPADKMVEGATTEDIMAAAVTDAMLEGTLENGQTGTSKKPVSLEKGEYVYFCPLNETPHYTVTVE